MTAAAKDVDLSDSAPDFVSKKTVSRLKFISIFLGSMVATITLVTGSARCYSGFVADIKDEARQEQHQEQIETRVMEVESAVKATRSEVEEVKKLQQLDQIRGSRIEGMVETLLKVNGKEPPAKTPAQVDAQKETGIY